MDRRKVLAGVAAIACAPRGRAEAQVKTPVRLLVLRRPGLSVTNACLAPCIRGHIYDISFLGEAAVTDAVIPLVKTKAPICDVIERPWADNAPNKSSIPRGLYKASIRTDASKTWMTTENTKWRIELEGVTKRTAIQFHYGQDVKWSEGCFIVGKLMQTTDEAGITAQYCKVEDSEAAIGRLKAVVQSPGYDPANLKIAVADDAGLFPNLKPQSACKA